MAVKQGNSLVDELSELDLHSMMKATSFTYLPDNKISADTLKAYESVKIDRNMSVFAKRVQDIVFI